MNRLKTKILTAFLLAVTACSTAAHVSPGSPDGGAHDLATARDQGGHDAAPSDGSPLLDAAIPVDLPPGTDLAVTSKGDMAIVTPSGDLTVYVEPDGTKIAQPLLTAIENAKSAVHVECYLLTNTTYIAALKTLVGKGIDVKVILNQTFPTGTAASSTNATSYTTLTSDKVPTHWAPTTTGFDSYTHEKAVIIDPGTATAQAWIMTMNIDTSAMEYNREYLVKDTSTADITEAEAIFQADYASSKITPTGALIVAPSPQNNAETAILSLINSAKTSIDIEFEEYDAAGIEENISNALVAKAMAKVAVHMVLEDSTNTSQASAVSALQAVGGKVVGYVYKADALDIHAKAIVIDGKTAFVGSENLSGGSLGYNRELGVIFDDPTQVKLVDTTIASDFAGGTTYN